MHTMNMKIGLLCSSFIFLLGNTQGFDVSHHQGHIAWDNIPTKYDFVYIKATQGISFTDPLFVENWQQAKQHKLHVGAYHFFNLCQNGAAQADLFIKTVPKHKEMLAPAIDLEYDTTCTKTKQELVSNIKKMTQKIKQHYGITPIIYTSNTFYNIVLKDSFNEFPLWLRDYKQQPTQKHYYWQYTNQGKISGISTPVDLNIKP